MRILIAGDSDADAARAEALVAACGLAVRETRRASLAAAIELMRDAAAWDLAIVAVPAAGPSHEVPELGLPLVFVADALTPEVSLAVQRVGARICVSGHGPEPLRLAILHAAKEHTRDRARALVYLSVSDVIFTLRVEGDHFRFAQINSAFTRATGLDEAQVVGRLVDDVIPEPSLSLVLARYRQAIAERRTLRWEEITEYPTGRKYGEVSVTPVVEADGRCTALIGTVHDVTEDRARDEAIRMYADLVRSVDVGLTVWDERGALAAYNPEAKRLAGDGLALGLDVASIFPGARGAEIAAMIGGVGDRTVERTLPRTAEDPRTFAAKAFPLPGGRVGVMLEDITARATAERIESAERRALECLADGARLEDCLAITVRVIEDVAPIGSIASILLLDAQGAHLRHGAAPGLPEAYTRAIDGAPIGPRAGSCGTAAFRGEPVIVADLETDPLWADYRELARPHGLRACWSFPIAGDDGRILGTFAIYRREPGRPDDAVLAAVARLTHVAAIVIGRRQLDDQLRALSARIEAVREEERTGIAREIHDELGQALTALKMDVAWIGRRLRDPDAIAAKLREMTDATDALIHAVRRISAELRPGILDDLGLVAAIEWQVDEFRRRTGIECDVTADIGEVRPDRALITAVFRIFQEALTNVARHAGASRVRVRVAIDGGRLSLEIADDGVGVPDGAPRAGLGLLGMRERARRLGGDLEVQRAARRGTIVSAQIPLAPEP